jgi:hypothetical protein
MRCSINKTDFAAAAKEGMRLSRSHLHGCGTAAEEADTRRQTLREIVASDCSKRPVRVCTRGRVRTRGWEHGRSGYASREADRSTGTDVGARYIFRRSVLRGWLKRRQEERGRKKGGKQRDLPLPASVPSSCPRIARPRPAMGVEGKRHPLACLCIDAREFSLTLSHSLGSRIAAEVPAPPTPYNLLSLSLSLIPPPFVGLGANLTGTIFWANEGN